MTLAIYGCNSKTSLSLNELRKSAVAQLKEGILDNNLRDYVFNLNKEAYYEFIQKFREETIGLDSNYILAEASAKKLARPMIFYLITKRTRKNSNYKI